MRDWLYGVVLLALTAAVALGVLRLTNGIRGEEDAARVLSKSEKPAEAEAIYAKIVARDPTVPHVLELVDAHHHAKARLVMFALHPDEEQGKRRPTAPMSDEALAAIVASLPRDAALIGRFAIGDEDARAELEAAAAREPPMRWANHALASDARGSGDDMAAAALYFREAASFPHQHDLEEGFACLAHAGAWDDIRARLDMLDAEVAPLVRYELALHDRDWRAAVRELPSMYRARFSARYVWLSLVAALAWGFFCARLGKVGERARFRVPLYLAAFCLGVASVAPTFVLIAIEEAKLHLVETGDKGRDALYFVFGVGLREELSKLLLFLPLVPILRRWGDKLDVLACGAMVGLGFAAEENLSYLADDNLHTGLGRFLTANFLHMAMTGILASVAFDLIEDAEKYGQEFMRASLLVVGLHGAYDFLIAHHELGGGFAAMVVFIVLAKKFLDAVDAARTRADRVITPMRAFIGALAVVTGASLAHAIATVGPWYGPIAMAEGVLGEAIIVMVFVRVLQTM